LNAGPNGTDRQGEAGLSEAQSLLEQVFASEIRAWRGEAALGPLFWGKGVGVSLLLIVFHASLMWQGLALVQQLSLMAIAAYTVWILVAVWRCAGRADPNWGTLARWLTVAWAANATLVLLFLQLDLVMAAFGG
jgi:hypothetical protein